ncbi:hypothetical protein [Streptomyces sp. RKND-216]|nr:hypothetical protein [Streptomyces sp. RKND-216]
MTETVDVHVVPPPRTGLELCALTSVTVTGAMRADPARASAS